MAKKKTTEVDRKISEKKSPFSGLKLNLKYKNHKQKEYAQLIKDNQIVLSLGPSGVGKSLIALFAALELLKDPGNPYKKLVLMVAPVQTDIEVGYLKGDLGAKLSPFAYSYLHNLADMLGDNGMSKVQELLDCGAIEIMCVSFARGINLQNCVCICGECQQYSKESFLTLITRLTETGKMIFEGDLNQTDNKNIRRGREESGLTHAKNVLQGVPGIGIIEFTKDEIVRNPLITQILELWDPETYGDGKSDL